MNIFGLKINNNDIDEIAKVLAEITLEHHDENIDNFLVTLDTIHSAVILYQQELADVSDGTIVFSKKYLGES